ncbi:MAG: hypothetical protein Q4F12_02365 [Erysipelotrichaceae bacterium]|nr:hypothetical protein [Erysipelotrichaceae bacterium]
MKHCIDELKSRYPQILMPIKKGIKDSEEYKNVVLRGEDCPYKDTFSRNPLDKLESVITPVGEVEVLSLIDRDDFIHAVRALGNKCEPVDVPDSTGAVAIFGLNNWEKVRAGKDNYKDSFIILSSGNYSNVTCDMVNEITNNDYSLTKDSWRDKSITIRKYHELTHFVMRKKYPEDIKAIRDELIADSVGIISAFGKLDERLLKLFLGVESDTYRKGGRLENYEGGSIEHIPDIIKQIDHLKELFNDNNDIDDIWNNIERYM